MMKEKMRFRTLPIRSIKPSGWYKRQLQIQADGLAGNLDRVWPDIRESKWIGGDKEGWERVPYWLDGFIPLACLLDDTDMKARAKRYIDAILAGQREDGWICPCTDEERSRYDMWAHFLLCKVLALYEECTGDPRIEKTIYRAMKCLKRHLETNTLFGWGSLRWFECLIPLGWLYDRKPEPWMKELALLLRVQGVNYEALFADWPYDKPQGRGFWNFQTHVVNLAMALKSEALCSAFFGKESDGFAKRMLDRLLAHHGIPAGHFSGDECLAGRDPRQGTELCGVVEAMYSCEWLLALSGDDEWADRLERLSFNALPAAISEDMWTHQYDQLTNQVQCAYLSDEEIQFNSNSGESHLFGLEPNYGCCTANMGQGWPKLSGAAILQAGHTIAIGAILPVSAETVADGIRVRVSVETEYPFSDSYTVRVCPEAPVTLTLSLRLPAGCLQACINGRPAEERRTRIELTAA
ncbi:MAG: glycoside hydrolase family 127 protein, partial [Parasporobacterium sp.]|nr:glycoside hydrolase family 127 protein [Parasporobacterium sp.]